MGNTPDSSGRDPREDPAEAAHDATPRSSNWISGQALAEILILELMMAEVPYCPRCRWWQFKYGRLQFCSGGCPENLLVRAESE